MNLELHLKRAFKKLKSSLYFDKTQLINRDKIVAYECDEKFSQRFSEIASLLNDDDETWENYRNTLLNSIQVLSFPKSLNKSKIKNEEVIFNEINGDISVGKIQHMFESDIEVQLLGVLWILTIGKEMDSEFYEHCYGNRLKKRLLNENTQNATFSPYLFKQYFEQYQSWRDTGLKIAEQCMDNNQDAIVITMDLKEFYYSVSFTKEHFDDFISDYQNKISWDNDFKVISRINMLVFEVLENFSSKIKYRSKDHICLPIGYLPSNILSNWYLKDFDSAISNRWNPIYYGRYVDDIIIVEKVEKNSRIFNEAKNQDLKQHEVIADFLCNCRSNPSAKCENGKGLFCTKDDLNTDKDKNQHNKKSEQEPPEEITYYINETILPKNAQCNISVQNSKVKVFYFRAGSSKALLTSFRNAINQNRSEFRFLPEDEAVLLYSDYSQIFELQRESGASINKFRELNDIAINKFNLSKFLGKLAYTSTLADDKKESIFEEDILKIFDSETIITHYMFWERILQIFLLSENLTIAETFINKIMNACDKTNFIHKNDSYFIDEQLQIKESKRIQKTLYRHLSASLNRSFALVWGVKLKILIGKIETQAIGVGNFVLMNTFHYENLLTLRQNYCKTRMINKYAMPALIDGLFESGWKPSDDSDMNLSNFSHYVNILKNENITTIKYQYFPYMVTLQDIEFLEYIKLLNNKPDNIPINFHIFNSCKKDYKMLNYPNSDNNASSDVDYFKHIKENPLNNNPKLYVTYAQTTLNTKNKVKIAIANAKLEDSNFKNLLTGKPNRTFDRYLKLANIVNCATKEKVDILIMPEAYVPFEWLPILARHSAKNNMVIITGVEHVFAHIYKNETMPVVMNLTATILPYSVDGKIISSHINLRNKVHYSPEEKRIIEGYRYSITKGTEYDLFRVNDFWFSVYCCFELASIHDRTLFANYVDATIAVEWNRDTNYYSNIIESLGRDLHCYCIQVNTSDYGDSRILRPTRTENKDIVRTKGGQNDTVLINEIDISGLRDFQRKEYELQKDDKRFKPTPPNFDKNILIKKINNELYDFLTKQDDKTEV